MLLEKHRQGVDVTRFIAPHFAQLVLTAPGAELVRELIPTATDYDIETMANGVGRRFLMLATNSNAEGAFSVLLTRASRESVHQLLSDLDMATFVRSAGRLQTCIEPVFRRFPDETFLSDFVSELCRSNNLNRTRNCLILALTYGPPEMAYNIVEYLLPQFEHVCFEYYALASIVLDMCDYDQMHYILTQFRECGYGARL